MPSRSNRPPAASASRPFRIAFAGRAGAGKSTAGEHLCAVWNARPRDTRMPRARVRALADPIYKIMHYAQVTLGMPLHKDRRFLQLVGTEWGRDRDPAMWVEHLTKSLKKSDSAAVCDLRFQNEIPVLRAAGFTLVRIDRPDGAGTGSAATDAHASEHGLDGVPDETWDAIIKNTGSLVDFVGVCERLLPKASGAPHIGEADSGGASRRPPTSAKKVRVKIARARNPSKAQTSSKKT